MFESIVSNLKSHSFRLTESISLDNIKLKASESLDNLKSNIPELTGSVSMYFNKPHNSPSKNTPSPILKKDSIFQNKPILKWPVLVNNQTVWVDYDTYQNELEEEEEEYDIVDRFVRVISLGEDDYTNRNVSAYYLIPTLLFTPLNNLLLSLSKFQYEVV